MKILIVTPACNEQDNLPLLIESVKNQSLLPCEWIIVDDGSVDSTSDVIKKAELHNSFIRYLRKEKIDKRSPGKSIIETFYFGFNNKLTVNYDIIMKLDADLILPTTYLQSISNEFLKQSKVGICGGICVLNNNGQYILEKETNMDHVRGAIKAYRKKCFEDIGGLLKNMGWDTVDEHYARFSGWEVLVLSNLRVLHQRSTNAEYGFVNAAYKNGKMLYAIRMDMFLVIGNSLKKVFKKPYFILSISMFLGFCVAFFNRDKFIVSKELGVFIRKYRYSNLMKRFLSIIYSIPSSRFSN